MAVEVGASLKRYRTELAPKVSQERMSKRAGVVLQTYRGAEAGGNCRYSTAKAILHALNSERSARNMIALGLDDLGLRIV